MKKIICLLIGLLLFFQPVLAESHTIKLNTAGDSTAIVDCVSVSLVGLYGNSDSGYKAKIGIRTRKITELKYVNSGDNAIISNIPVIMVTAELDSASNLGSIELVLDLPEDLCGEVEAVASTEQTSIKTESLVVKKQEQISEKSEKTDSPQAPKPIKTVPHLIKDVGCVDSDNGKDKYTKGTVTYGAGGSNTDICIEKTPVNSWGSTAEASDYLVEYSCPTETNYGKDIYLCENGCNNGVCLKQALSAEVSEETTTISEPSAALVEEAEAEPAKPSRPAIPGTLSSYPSFFVSPGEHKSWIIMGESAAAPDVQGVADIAQRFGVISGKSKSVNIIDTEIISDQKADNLILVGGPVTNSLVREINPLLPVRFEQKNNLWYITGGSKEYNGYDNPGIGMLVITKNPYNPDKNVIIAAGLTRWGTKAATDLLAQEKNDELLSGKVIIVNSWGDELEILEVIDDSASLNVN